MTERAEQNPSFGDFSGVSEYMGIDVDTKDCTAVTDAELEEMADLCAESSNPFSIGLLSKQTEEWVLASVARENGKLRGFTFSTLERIGGTPCVLVGMGSVVRNSKRDTVLRALVQEQMHRALMAFPDEDVLFGMQLNDAAGYDFFKSCVDVNPRPDHKANGEERAWGRRVAKRVGIGASRYDDRSFIARGDGSQPRVFDHEALKPEKIDDAIAAQFADVDVAEGDSLIVAGWVNADDLMKLG